MRLMLMAAALGLAAAPSAYAQSAPSPDPLADRFLQALKNGQVDEALKGAAGDSKLFANRIAADPTIAAQIESAIKTYGPVLSWERVAGKSLGTTVRRDTYIVRHRDMVTRWRFFFIRAEKGWSIGSFAFEDQVPTWFNESD